MRPTCVSGKVCYTKREAQGAINAIYRNRKKGSKRYRRHRPDNLRCYQCPDCNHHHLTSH